VSSSTRENSTLDQARAGLQSAPFLKLAEMTPGAESGFGFWADGAEESRIVSLENARALAQMAARLGKAAQQKAVVYFAEGDGNDVAHVLTVPDSDPARVAAEMLRHGIEYKTIVPGGSSSGVIAHVLDFGGGLSPNVEAYARESRAAHARRIGTAHLVGGETREEGLRAFERILQGVARISEKG